MAPLPILSLLFNFFQATYLLFVIKSKFGVIGSGNDLSNDELFPEIENFKGVSLILFRDMLSLIYFLIASAWIDSPTVLGAYSFSTRRDPIRTLLNPKLSPLLAGHFPRVSKPFDLLYFSNERDYCFFP